MENSEREYTNETTFENARVGDRVWSRVFGWGEVVKAEGYKGLCVEFPDGQTIPYNYHGGFMGDNGDYSLFWNEIIFPTRPKRMVKRINTIYVNIPKIKCDADIGFDVFDVIEPTWEAFETIPEAIHNADNNSGDYFRIAWPVKVSYTALEE